MNRATPRSTLAQEIGKRDPFESLEQEAFLSVLRTADALASDFERLFREHGITAAQFNALRILRGHDGPVATRRVGGEMVTREPDITRLIDRLERVGLVTRERCREDRRVVYVKLAEPGRALLASLDTPVLDLHRRQLSGLGPRKLTQLIRLLNEARAAAGAGGES